MFGQSSHTCLGCGKTSITLDKLGSYATCPYCLTHVGQSTPVPLSAGGPKQLVRVYFEGGLFGKTDIKQFQEEEPLLARLGWRHAYSRRAGEQNHSFRVLTAIFTRT